MSPSWPQLDEEPLANDDGVVGLGLRCCGLLPEGEHGSQTCGVEAHRGVRFMGHGGAARAPIRRDFKRYTTRDQGPVLAGSGQESNQECGQKLAVYDHLSHMNELGAEEMT